MRTKYLGSAAALSLSIFLSACGNNSQGAGGTRNAPLESGAFNLVAQNAIAVAPISEIMPDEAARFAKQASFGPSIELIDEIVLGKSIATWIDKQFLLSTSTYTDIASKPTPSNSCSALSGTALSNCNRDTLSAVPVQARFYANAVNNNDQLRQRVAFALSQIVVASEIEVHSTAGLAAFQQMLLSNAFGNYRDILRTATLNPYMGDYLDMADSSKAQPNENYARELMQLFSIGTVLLNPDGTPQTDNTGTTIQSYSNTDVKEISRALTGWTYSQLNGAALGSYYTRDYSKPMITYTSRFDDGAKAFLGKMIPAGTAQQANLDAVVDTLFNHPNTAPFVSKRLIQQLTVSNPTPAYVERVAAVFADNGLGVRGDLKAVVRAIYLDDEARVVSQAPGKVKEPVLLLTSLARAIGFKTDGYAFVMRDSALGQAVFRAPSVFNYYSYEFPLPNGAGLLSPASKIMTTSTVINRHNLVYDWTIAGDTARSEFAPTLTSLGTTPQWSTWETNGADDNKTIDRINLVLLNGAMTAVQRQALVSSMATIKYSDPAIQARRRAVNAIYTVASSPLFQVDR